jgi:hypothetical protein
MDENKRERERERERKRDSHRVAVHVFHIHAADKKEVTNLSRGIIV